MNITLSADEDLITKTREYAKKHNTSLNNLVREYLKQLVNENEIKLNISEFTALARDSAGKSSKNYKFNREDIYTRGL